MFIKNQLRLSASWTKVTTPGKWNPSWAKARGELPRAEINCQDFKYTNIPLYPSLPANMENHILWLFDKAFGYTAVSITYKFTTDCQPFNHCHMPVSTPSRGRDPQQDCAPSPVWCSATRSILTLYHGWEEGTLSRAWQTPLLNLQALIPQPPPEPSLPSSTSTTSGASRTSFFHCANRKEKADQTTAWREDAPGRQKAKLNYRHSRLRGSSRHLDQDWITTNSPLHEPGKADYFFPTDQLPWESPPSPKPFPSTVQKSCLQITGGTKAADTWLFIFESILLEFITLHASQTLFSWTRIL